MGPQDRLRLSHLILALTSSTSVKGRLARLVVLVSVTAVRRGWRCARFARERGVGSQHWLLRWRWRGAVGRVAMRSCGHRQRRPWHGCPLSLRQLPGRCAHGCRRPHGYGVPQSGLRREHAVFVRSILGACPFVKAGSASPLHIGPPVLSLRASLLFTAGSRHF